MTRFTMILLHEGMVNAMICDVFLGLPMCKSPKKLDHCRPASNWFGCALVWNKTVNQYEFSELNSDCLMLKRDDSMFAALLWDLRQLCPHIFQSSCGGSSVLWKLIALMQYAIATVQGSQTGWTVRHTVQAKRHTPVWICCVSRRSQTRCALGSVTF